MSTQGRHHCSFSYFWLPVIVIIVSYYCCSTLKFLPEHLITSSDAGSMAPQSIYDFTVKDYKGQDVNLSTYKGKVLLIVNVASQCGLTASNYKELTEVYNKFKGQDFEILAFPCNQFGGQEPGSNQEIQEFACTRYKAEFPIFDKIDVNGKNTAPLYEYLKKQKRGHFGKLYQMELHQIPC